jgi:hypothetical protein
MSAESRRIKSVLLILFLDSVISFANSCNFLPCPVPTKPLHKTRQTAPMSGTLTKEIHQPIRFIIVGGSVAGLCAAYTLRQSGHDVVVVDKRDEEVEASTH